MIYQNLVSVSKNSKNNSIWWMMITLYKNAAAFHTVLSASQNMNHKFESHKLTLQNNERIDLYRNDRYMAIEITGAFHLAELTGRKIQNISILRHFLISKDYFYHFLILNLVCEGSDRPVLAKWKAPTSRNHTLFVKH